MAQAQEAPVPIFSDEAVATKPRLRALAAAVTLVAVAMSLYHMYVAAFGPPEAIVFSSGANASE